MYRLDEELRDRDILGANSGALNILTSGARGKESSYGLERLRRVPGEVVLSPGLIL